MSTTYTTTITAMYTVPNPTGYVVNVQFNVSGTDGTYTANIDGNIQFTPEQGEVGFIPYNLLTQAEVIGWINTATNNQENYYANVQGQINSMITPPVSPSSQPLPWSA
jgi:hypothetical protein